MQIWDSAGQEKFKSLIPNYIRGASLVILVYDISNKKSFDNLNSWIEFINTYENTNIVICGNKIDLKDKREISFEEGKKFSEEKKMDFFEVSAKEETNLLKMFFSSISTLPIFSNLNNENLNKEELIKELEKENNDNLTNREEDNLGIGNEAKNKKLNIIPTTGKRDISSSLPENSIEQSENAKNIGQKNLVEEKKIKTKKKKCC